MQNELNAFKRVFPNRAFELKKLENTTYVLTQLETEDCYIWKESGYFLFLCQRKGDKIPDFEMVVDPTVFFNMIDLVSFVEAKF